MHDMRGRIHICFMVIFIRLQSFIIKNINFSRLPFVLFMFFNVYIIVFYSLAVLLNMTWEISSPLFFLRRLSLCSGEITCVSYFQQFHCCQHAEISESSEEEWRDLSEHEEGKDSRLISSFASIALSLRCSWRCHKCATFFARSNGMEANITITTHYPRSHKTK